MNELTKRLATIKNGGGKALIPFMTAGDPALGDSEKLMTILADNGADVIELGIPFSDPLADGPVLQLAANRAIAAGTSTTDVFELVARFRQNYQTPVVLLVYFNQIYSGGVEVFCKEAAQAGVSGLVVPDLPFEEAEILDTACHAAGMINIRFLAPTTSKKRMDQICKSAQGFIYCVTVTGVTGQRAELGSEATALLQQAAQHTEVPLALGFGISTPAQAKEAAVHGDCIIVGSALVKKITESKPDDREKVAASFIRSLREAIDEEENYGNQHDRNCSACG